MNKTKLILTWAGGALSLLLVSCSSSSNLVQASPPSSQERVIAERVFSLVNSERAKSGKSALKGSRVLNSMAQSQSKFLATSHLTEGKPSTFGSHNRAQYAALKYGIENVGEIDSTVATSVSDPARAVVNAWMSKTEHSRHLKQTWDMTGVGVHEANGKYYITMMVGVRPGGVPNSMKPGGVYR